MSVENVRVVRRMLGEGNVYAVDADLRSWVDEFFAPEIEWHDAPTLPGAAVYHGREAFARHVADYLESWSESRVEIEEVRPVGDRVLARIRYVGVGRQSGIALEDNEVVAVYDVRGGSILRVRHFTNEADALAAAGLPE
jgi:ketosteroid isomerase-like protein